MSIEFIAVDVETADSCHERICAIGITKVYDNGTFETEYTLVDPECRIENTYTHGLSEKDVIGAPKFPAVWEKYGHLISDNIVAVHNAAFDLNVLKKMLSLYHIWFDGSIRYIDTLRIARKLNLSVSSNSLSPL